MQYTDAKGWYCSQDDYWRPTDDCTGIGEDLNITKPHIDSVGGDKLEELDDDAMRHIVNGTAIFSV